MRDGVRGGVSAGGGGSGVQFDKNKSCRVLLAGNGGGLACIVSRRSPSGAAEEEAARVVSCGEVVSGESLSLFLSSCRWSPLPDCILGPANYAKMMPTDIGAGAGGDPSRRKPQLMVVTKCKEKRRQQG